jgi:hypothetical protein
MGYGMKFGTKPYSRENNEKKLQKTRYLLMKIMILFNYLTCAIISSKNSNNINQCHHLLSMSAHIINVITTNADGFFFTNYSAYSVCIILFIFLNDFKKTTHSI